MFRFQSGKGRNFSILTNIQTGYEAYPAPCYKSTGVLVPGLKQLRPETERPTLCSVEVETGYCTGFIESSNIARSGMQ